jgi:hypothetical protein
MVCSFKLEENLEPKVREQVRCSVILLSDFGQWEAAKRHAALAAARHQAVVAVRRIGEKQQAEPAALQ